MAELTIEQLRRALVPPAAPPAERVAAFRALVLAQPTTPPPPPPPGRFGWLRDRWLLIVLAVLAVIIAALTVTFFLNIDPPAGTIRDVARELGLPVDSSHLKDARATADKLRDALAASDQPEARQQALVLGEQLNRLDADERAKITDADDLIKRATQIPATGSTTTPGSGPGPGSTTATTLPSSTTSTTLPTGSNTAPGLLPDNVPVALASLVVTPDRTTAPVGDTVTITVAGRSASGADLGDVTGQSQLGMAPSGSCTGSTCTASTPGRRTITAKVGSVEGSAVVTFIAGPVERLELTPVDPTAPAGGPVSFTVLGFDRFGNALGNISDRSAFTISPDGSCTGSSCSATRAGPHTVQATAAGITRTTSLLVVPGPPVALSVSPPSVQTLSNVARTFVVHGADSFGNDTGDFTSATTFGIGPNGSCQANSCSAAIPGTHLVTARMGQLTGSATMDVFAGVLDRIAVTPARVTVPAGATQLFTVEGFDASGNRLLDLTPAARFRITPDGTCVDNGCRAASVGPHQIAVDADGKTASAILDAVVGPTERIVLTLSQTTATTGVPVTFTVKGLDAFGNVTGDLTGAALMTVTPDGSCAGGSCTATVAGPHVVTVTVGGFTAIAPMLVTPGATTRLDLTPATATVPAGGSQVFTVQGRDPFGNPTGDLTSKAVFTVSPDGSCVGSSCTAGVAGPHTVSAVVDGVSALATMDVVPGSPQQLTVLAAAIATAGTSQPFTVQGLDGFGNPIGDLTDKAVFSIEPDGACVKNTCQALKAGAHTVIVLVGEIKGSAQLLIVAADLSSLQLTPGSATAAAGQTQTYSAEGFDAFGNSLGDVASFGVFTIGPDGHCNGTACGATTAGPHTVTATIGAVQGSAALQVVGGTLSRIAATPVDGTVVAGKMQAFDVQGFDPFDNPLGDHTALASFAITPEGECTNNACGATHAGLYTVTASIGELKVAVPLRVVAAELTGLALTPADGQAVAGQVQPFTAMGLDQFGNPTGDVTSKASFTIEPDGTCEKNSCGSTKAGVHKVTAVVGDAMGSATLHVVPATVTRLALSPQDQVAEAYTYLTYTLSGFDAFGNEVTGLEDKASFAIEPNGYCTRNVCSAPSAGVHYVGAAIDELETFVTLRLFCPGHSPDSEEINAEYANDEKAPRCACASEVSSAPQPEISTNSVCVPASKLDPPDTAAELGGTTKLSGLAGRLADVAMTLAGKVLLE